MLEKRIRYICSLARGCTMQMSVLGYRLEKENVTANVLGCTRVCAQSLQ